MGATEYQSLTIHTRWNYKKKENHHHNKNKDKKQTKFKGDPSNIWCYTCDEKGHFVRYCSKNKYSFNEKKKRHHAHTAKHNELKNKRFGREKDDSDEEYVLISSLIGTISYISNYWPVDSGASKHITRYKESFVNMYEDDAPHKVKLGDDYQYPIKGSGEAS